LMRKLWTRRSKQLKRLINEMKTLFTIFAIVAVVFSSVAQTNYVKTEFKTITATNWVKPGPYLRIVNSQLYNTYYSELWGNPLKAAGLSGVMSGGFGTAYAIRVEKVDKDKIVCGIYRQSYRPETYTGMAQLADEEFFEDIVIYHYPNAESLMSGQDLGECRCMRVANYNSGDVSLIALDCGIQATNLVPLVKEEKIKVASTNSVAK
jgi:hypothetical protein